MQVIGEFVQNGWPATDPGLAQQVFHAGGAGEPAHRLPGQAELPTNGLDALPRSEQGLYLLVSDRNKVELCLTPTSASWANPIEAQFGQLRTFTMANSNHPNHTILARETQKYLRWRNANARHPDVLAAQRRERARVRSERQHRWGRPRTNAA
ncbi:hypothetical protein Van01_64360 [Micromonospora andamanensis]|uniref:Integrase catalytic domain-containing protein n=1 Tax=Micromonospora andamanensis TaxID=1287068 RepID=A0ABQ4I5Q9_9ACTN|nr:hypothetical protein Van01_64360 [Micromonospora andamanensis]